MFNVLFSVISFAGPGIHPSKLPFCMRFHRIFVNLAFLDIRILLQLCTSELAQHLFFVWVCFPGSSMIIVVNKLLWIKVCRIILCKVIT